jgi:hypothetical protein
MASRVKEQEIGRKRWHATLIALVDNRANIAQVAGEIRGASSVNDMPHLP